MNNVAFPTDIKLKSMGKMPLNMASRGFVGSWGGWGELRIRRLVPSFVFSWGDWGQRLIQALAEK